MCILGRSNQRDKSPNAILNPVPVLQYIPQDPVRMRFYPVLLREVQYNLLEREGRVEEQHAKCTIDAKIPCIKFPKFDANLLVHQKFSSLPII
jgi:hypothetical protein